MQPWDRQKNETGTAYERFAIYLEMGKDRSLRKVAEHLGKGHNYVRTLEGWSSKYSWVDRAAAYDTALLEESLKTRRLVIESTRQSMIDKVSMAVDTLLAVAQDPDAAATARVSAAREILDRAGVTAVKKVELSGPEGGAIPVEASRFVEGLDLEVLASLSAELGEEPHGDG